MRLDLTPPLNLSIINPNDVEITKKTFLSLLIYFMLIENLKENYNHLSEIKLKYKLSLCKDTRISEILALLNYK